jgi:hypothetical protein
MIGRCNYRFLFNLLQMALSAVAIEPDLRRFSEVLARQLIGCQLGSVDAHEFGLEPLAVDAGPLKARPRRPRPMSASLSSWSATPIEVGDTD